MSRSNQVDRRLPSLTSTLASTLASVLTSALILGVTPSTSQAAGLYFSERGVRPMGRAGAFVAGADDAHSVWYNPAGLADAGDSFLADFAYLRFNDEYTRRLRILDADGTYQNVVSPTITGSAPLIPLPTLVGTWEVYKNLVVAAGLIAPYIALASYADRVAGQPSPARYTLGSFDGSLMAIPGVWVGWKPIPSLRVGAGVFALVGNFVSTVTFSVSPQDRLLGAPEQPEWDAASQLKVGPIVAPSGIFGVIWEPDPHVRLGLSGSLPLVVDANATLKVRLPTTAALDSAKVTGDSAHVHFVLPAILRVGIEVRPIPDLRIEATYVREFWSTHQSIDATPNGISLDNIPGAPKSVALPVISIPRGFQDSSSYRLGGEGTLMLSGYRLDIRAGISFETTAVPAGYMSLSSIDFDKTTFTIGSGLFIKKNWRFDAVFAQTVTQPVDVQAGEAKIPRISPLRGNAPLEAVNAGNYRASANLFGVGLQYKFN